ncbi:hypothetical protein [Pseudomonas peli]|uniref:hypothetical protein n=1 Tax=Pseudomonas peli TaxID=592361 RepID=UPI0028610E09|nr:hypothetical protein [Pseudomonas peli]MDR7024367.1 hypothetical protein [Pseudomonas peli]
MSNQPQCPIEEIELIPHPLDAWRAALNALIAVAPGSSADVAYHLNDARKCTLICRDFSAASQGEAKLIDRLMLLGAGKLVGKRLDAASAKQNSSMVNDLGFSCFARTIGEPPAPQPAHHTASPSSVQPLPHRAAQASGGLVAPPAGTGPALQPLLPGEVLLEPEHSPALSTPQSDRS